MGHVATRTSRGSNQGSARHCQFWPARAIRWVHVNFACLKPEQTSELQPRTCSCVKFMRRKLRTI
jgi:hypothetical protein